MVELLTHEQILLFKEVFSLHDKDGDGELNSRELGAVMHLLCDPLDDVNAGELSSKRVGTVMHLLCEFPTETDLQPIMNVIDHHNNCKITFAHFLYVVARIVKGEVSEKKLKEAFRVLDKNKTGFITAMDLRHSMTSVGEILTQDEVNETLQKSDIKENMKVNYDEFVKMMTRGEVTTSKALPEASPGGHGIVKYRSIST